MGISRDMHDITFEVVRTSQQGRITTKKLLAKAADAVVWGESTIFDREVQEELDQKTIKAEREEVWAALEADRSLLAWVVGTLKNCVRGALSNDERQGEVLRNVTSKSTDFLRRIVASHNDAGSVDVVRVHTLQSLQPHQFVRTLSCPLA